MAEAATITPVKASGGFGTFERYLSLWVALCMVAGIGIGKLLPGAIATVRSLEFVKGVRSTLRSPY
jgi:ACR3 family arsenite efflux pump ArsB